MEKLPMCRLCLVQNVRMYIVVNRQLHQLYEKLTDIPFVTEDCRPILACFLCLSKLKRCWRLLRKCLESDEQFVKIMKEEYEPDPAINLDCFELYSGLSTSPIQRMSTVDECQTESNNITIKQEIPDVCEGLDEFIEIEEEHQSDELEPDHLYQSSLEVEVDIPPQHSESDSEDDKPLIEFETEEVEEEEVYKMELNATETKRSDTDFEYEGGAPRPSNKKTLRSEIVHKKCMTTYSRQAFQPSETHSTDNESRRLNKTPKTAAERAREFRARRALLKQQSKQQQEPDATVEIATEGLSEIRTIEKRANSAKATRRWREKKKGVNESSKKQAKTVAERMREYRKRKKVAKQILWKQQRDQDLDAYEYISTPSSQVNQRAGPSTINTISTELPRRGFFCDCSQQQIETSGPTREYRERRNENISIESNNPSRYNEEQSDLRDSTLTVKNDDIIKHNKKAHENFDRKVLRYRFGYSCTVCNGLWFKND